MTIFFITHITLLQLINRLMDSSGTSRKSNDEQVKPLPAINHEMFPYFAFPDYLTCVVPSFGLARFE